MKGVLVLFIAAFAVSHANQCPSEQESDWTIEKLLVHKDCDKFYKCTYGEPIEKDCPSGLYFNIDLLQCDWPFNVDCGDRNVPGQEPKPEPQPEPEPEPQPEPEPEPQPEPEPEPQPEPEPEPQPEPEPEPQPEPEPEPQPEPEPEPQPEPEPEPQPEPEPEPQPEPEPEPQPEPEPEPQPEPEPEPQPEPEPEPQPEPEPEPQPEPEPEPQPEPEPEPQPEPEPEPQPEPEPEPELEFRPNGCPVDPFIHWLLPNAEDCNAFYYCVWGELVPRVCPETLHFNPVLQVCDWPQDAGCQVVASFNKHYDSRVMFRN